MVVNEQLQEVEANRSGKCSGGLWDQVDVNCDESNELDRAIGWPGSP